MKGLFRKLIVGTFILLAANGLQAQGTRENPILNLRIENLMSSTDFKACGLEKLTPEELVKLNVWLQSYTMQVIEAITKASTPDVIESHIDGDFEGWEGETIFKLENGQIWQQESYAYMYHYAYRPEVVIYKTDGGYKMKVEDVEKTITVKRIK